MIWPKVLFFFSLLAIIIVFVTYMSKRDIVDDEEESIDYGSVELVPTIFGTTLVIPERGTILRVFYLDSELFHVIADGEGGVVLKNMD